MKQMSPVPASLVRFCVLASPDSLAVVDAIDESIGKFPKALGNVVVIESLFIEKLINDFIADMYRRMCKRGCFVND